MDQDTPDCRLNERMARLEERMNTMQARYEGALERLRTDIATGREDAVKRDKANIQWLVGTVFGAAILIITVLGLLLR